MAELRDCYDYFHWFGVEESSLCPPSYSKSSCLIAAAFHNNVEKLKVLLDSPEWYGVSDNCGRTLLHVAVMLERVEVFNYLLSLEGFPLDAVDDKEDTALISYLKLYHKKPEYFPKTLIRRGADLNLQDRDGQTALHICCKRFDHTDNRGILIEIIAMLLYYGADPSITDYSYGYNVFEVCVIWTLGHDIWSDEIYSITEQLFYLTFDELASCKIDFKVLILLAHKKCPLFYRLYDCVKDVRLLDDSLGTLYTCLLQLNLEDLKLLKEKFEDGVREVLLTCRCFREFDFALVKLENVQFLLETNLKSATIEAISNEDTRLLVQDLAITGDENMSTEKICFMMSYGMEISTLDLDILHSHFNNCELFRMLLYMDLKECDTHLAFTSLYYDVTTDIENICLPFELTSYQTDLLLGLCAHQKMKDHCSPYGDEDVARKVENLPQMPSLVERARNVFREYFIREMKITSARQFYTMVKLLPISTVFKDIITYHRKIY